MTVLELALVLSCVFATISLILVGVHLGNLERRVMQLEAQLPTRVVIRAAALYDLDRDESVSLR